MLRFLSLSAVSMIVVAFIAVAPVDVRGQSPCTTPPCPTACPQCVGNWDPPLDWGVSTGGEFGHAVHLMTGPQAGKLLIWLTRGPSTYTAIWNPSPATAGNLTFAGEIVGVDIFCSSHTARMDGTILVSGGNPPPPPPPAIIQGYDCRDVSHVPVDGIPPPWNPNATPFPERPRACWPCTDIRHSYLFDPMVPLPGTGLPGGWSARPLMNGSRYYPSQVALPGGLIPNLAAGDPIVIAGTQDKQCAVDDPNPLYWPQLNHSINARVLDGHYLRGWEYPHATTGVWTELGIPPATSAYIGWPGWPTPGPTPNTPYFRWFPQTFLLAGTPAKVFVAGDTHVDFVKDPAPMNPDPTFTHWQVQNRLQTSYKIDVAASTITAVATGTQDRFYSSAVILNTLTHPNRILRFGGSTGEHNASDPLGIATAAGLPSVEEWDETAATPAWVPKANLAHERLFQNAVILPTGEILIIGGSSQDYHNRNNQSVAPVMQCEIYNPGSGPTALGSTTVVASISRPRVYHSVAALLQDGRVASIGGHDVTQPPGFGVSKDSVQVYSPPYFFYGSRPVINSVVPTASVSYNSIVTVNFVPGAEGSDGGGGGGSEIDLKVVLIKPASVSHHFDFDQRYVELGWTVASISGSTQALNVTTPLNATYAPPGYYMLFVVQNTSLGPLPSAAATIQLGP
jgi:Domain of unknown function (DUF1929)